MKTNRVVNNAVFPCLLFSAYISMACAEFPICSNSSQQVTPAVSGTLVVWQDNRSGSQDIYGYALSTGTEFPICTNGSNQTAPAISGDIVVWQDNRVDTGGDIYGYNLTTVTEFIIASGNAYDQMSPAISGTIVVWQDNRVDTGGDIYGYNLTAQSEFLIAGGTAYDQINPAVSGDIVVWQDSRNGSQDIYGYNLTTVTEFPICTNGSSQIAPAISGDIVVWQDNRADAGGDIYGYDLTTLTEFLIAGGAAYDQINPAVSGHIVIWQDNRSGSWGIYGYDLHSKTEFVVVDGAEGNQISPAVSGDIVVWQDNRSGSQDIYARHYQDTCDLRSPDNEVTEDVFLECPTWLSTGSDVSSCGYNDPYDIWYLYTPSQGGPVLVSTEGSDFDTVLSVYQACGGPEVACNDDYSLDNTQSRISLDVVKGKTYVIRISGFNEETGVSILSVTRIGCQNRPLSDVSGDCFVDMQDLVILANEWLLCGMQNPADCP